jgi:hypothetical protein
MFKNVGNQKKNTGYVRRTCIIGYEVQSKLMCKRSFGCQMKIGCNYVRSRSPTWDYIPLQVNPTAYFCIELNRHEINLTYPVVSRALSLTHTYRRRDTDDSHLLDWASSS